ncbi:MAG: sensor histidine kinase [Acetobacteraceae bacterium]
MKRIVLPRLLRAASFRFTALYVALFAASAIVLATAVFLESRSALQQQMTARIESEMTYLQHELHANGLDHLRTVIAERGQGPGALDYLLQDAVGAPLAGEIPAIANPKPGWMTLHLAEMSEDGLRGENVRALVSDLQGGLILAVGGDLRQINDLEEAIITAFLWTVLLAALLGITGGALLSRAFLHRIDLMVRTAEAIIDGDMERRVPVRGTGDDLDRLATTLNRMLDRIGTLMDSLRQVSNDVAHDLRTPLARLYHRLEDAREHARSVADFQASIDAALREADNLLETFSALLRIAQVEGGAPAANFSLVDLSALTEIVVDAYRPDAEATDHTMTIAAPPGVMVLGDRELLTQALANLVENALRHTPPGTDICIHLYSHPHSGAVLTIKDNGPGVAVVDLPRLTDRFYRGEHSRTTPGNGLGLSLVSAVAELHHAHLSLRTLQPGLQVDVSFPPVAMTACHPGAAP